VRRGDEGVDLLFDGKLACSAIFALCLVNTAIGATADEAYNVVALVDALFGVIAGEHGLCGICRVYWAQISIM
jgi:hypothetical protein